jgi:hypothetical protein
MSLFMHSVSTDQHANTAFPITAAKISSWLKTPRESSKRREAKIIQDAVEEVEDEEDEHLYHSTGWARELWIESLGMPAVLSPPEEEKDVKTAIGATRAKQDREKMIS